MDRRIVVAQDKHHALRPVLDRIPYRLRTLVDTNQSSVDRKPCVHSDSIWFRNPGNAQQRFDILPVERQQLLGERSD